MLSTTTGVIVIVSAVHQLAHSREQSYGAGKMMSASSWDPYAGRDRSFIEFLRCVIPYVTKAISLVPYDQTATDTRKDDSAKILHVRGNWYFGLFLEALIRCSFGYQQASSRAKGPRQKQRQSITNLMYFASPADDTL
eukprot:scaffold1170_cov125-Skeletonema_marinoi.AAC.5